MPTPEKEGFLRRNAFYDQNAPALARLGKRAMEKTVETGVVHCVVCIDPDDKMFRPLVDVLMPVHDWEEVRRKEGPQIVARGVVPRDAVEAYVDALRAFDVLERERPHLEAGVPYSEKDAYIAVFVMAAGGVLRVLVNVVDGDELPPPLDPEPPPDFPTTYYGPGWPAHLDPQPPCATDSLCAHCEEAITLSDSWAKSSTVVVGQIARAAMHRECFMRLLVGSVGHQTRQCSCYGGTLEDPRGLTRRQAARMALALYEKDNE